MAKWYKSGKGIEYLEITFVELINYSGNPRPICDNCTKDLVGYNDIILIPYANEAFCKLCGTKRLSDMKVYPDDIPIKEKRELFFREYFNIK